MTANATPTTTEVTAYIGLGANLGAAQQTLRQASQALDQIPHTRLTALSRLYRSAPVDAQGPDYINAVARVQTQLSPLALLEALQTLEQTHGRVRSYRNAPRTLDLDLLLFGQESIQTPRLTLPHPRMHERAFVLLPLAEIAPGLQLAQGSLHDLAAQCQDQRIEPLNDPFTRS